jgi:hypothetical protein
LVFPLQADKKEKQVEENTTIEKKVADGGEYFAVAHIFASFNDTFVVWRKYTMSCCEPLNLLFCCSTSLICQAVKLCAELPVA